MNENIGANMDENINENVEIRGLETSGKDSQEKPTGTASNKARLTCIKHRGELENFTSATFIMVARPDRSG